MRGTMMMVAIAMLMMMTCLTQETEAHGRNDKTVVSDPTHAAKLAAFAASLPRPPKVTLHVWEEEIEADPTAGPVLSNLRSSAALYAAVAPYLPPGQTEFAHVHAMNELYISAPVLASSKGSDNVFVTPHMDGPYGVVPGATLLRCLYMVQGSAHVATVFPMPGPGNNLVLATGDTVCFDYNREVHYIVSVPANETETGGEEANMRVAMKLHVAIAPPPLGLKYATWFGHINAAYNTWARNNFLASQNPDEYWGDWIMSAYINVCTVAGTQSEVVLGMANILMVAFIVVSIWRLRASARPLPDARVLPLFMTEVTYALSFLHYTCYIFAYVFRDVQPGIFIRDALALKTMSMALLTLAFVRSIRSLSDVGPALLALPCFGVSYLAYEALGKDLTYFGIEMGYAEPRMITQFPYGVIPHPMILGSVAGFLLLLLTPAFRAQWTPLILIHVGFYSVVLVLEMFDIYMPEDASTTFPRLGVDFLAFHTVPANVYGHLITVAVGMAGAFGAIASYSRPLGGYVVGLFVISLRYTVEPHVAQVADVTAVLVLGTYAVLALLPLPFLAPVRGKWAYVAMVVVAFVLQEAAHRFTFEKTFMDSYFAQDGFDLVGLKLLLHNIWLAPYTVWALYVV